MYKIYLLESPKKFLKKIKNKKLLLKFAKVIENLKHDPTPTNSKKLIGVKGYRLRVGDYRILYTLEKTIKIVEIFKIGHRRDIYK